MHSKYQKSFQDLPIQGKKVIIVLKNKNMFCVSHDCQRYTFSEKFSFLNLKAKKTKRLIDEIIRISLTHSSISAAKYLSETTVDIKKSSICNYLKKTFQINKENIRYICIDDFAIKKRKSYGTIMIDVETSCIVDLLESRDMEDVSKWLKEYPNIKIVIRDGSITYRAAINDAHPNAIQVNDRFHIIKSLVKSITKVLQRIISGRIEIPLTSDEAKLRYKYLMGLTRREKIIEAKRLRGKGTSYSEIAKELQVSETTAAKYVKIKDNEIPEEHISKREKEHIDAVEKVKKK